jgi:hypothetical protein
MFPVSLIRINFFAIYGLFMNACTFLYATLGLRDTNYTCIKCITRSRCSQMPQAICPCAARRLSAAVLCSGFKKGTLAIDSNISVQDSVVTNGRSMGLIPAPPSRRVHLTSTSTDSIPFAPFGKVPRILANRDADSCALPCLSKPLTFSVCSPASEGFQS